MAKTTASPGVDFTHDLRFRDLPAAVVGQAKACLLDLAAAGASGLGTPVSGIIRDHAARHLRSSGRGARMLLDGRRVGPTGAALAGGMTIDAFDSHDGHVLTKGHAGAAVLPALLAALEDGKACDGREVLTGLVLGYEIAIRAGIATHRVSKEYPTSGSWNALGAAAVAARRWKLPAAATRHALGIAEYHGPRSPMMRCIDFPTMVKDGSGWGAMVGVDAALLAQAGFTGAPAMVAEGEEVRDLWSDLGQRWRILELYFKPFPVCRWAQPAIRATLGLMAQHGIVAKQVADISVATFHEATRLASRTPATTEEAQYSLPFPVAAAMIHGRVGPAEIDGAGLRDRAVLAMSRRIRLIDDAGFSAEFPARRIARVEIAVKDGRSFRSEPTEALGDPERPFSAEDLAGKYQALATPILGPRRTARLAAAVAGLSLSGSDAASLVDLLLAAPRRT